VPEASQREVLFVQGAGDKDEPDGSGRLIAYLQDALGDGFAVLAPDMPEAASDPRYGPWAGRIKEELAVMGVRPILVGHSLGASVLLRWLAEGGYGRPVGGLFLVATPDWGPAAGTMPSSRCRMASPPRCRRSIGWSSTTVATTP
jgi:uncharacterized protein